MNVKFKKTFATKNNLYGLGEINMMYGYAMEITELRPRLSAGKLQPGEAMLIFFGITPEEYEMRETNPKRLEQLAAAIRKSYPADRLLSYLVLNFKGDIIARDVQLETVPTIDENGFPRPAAQGGAIDAELNACARLQEIPADAPEGVKQDWIAARRAAAQALLKLDSFFVAYDLLTNGRYPAQSFDGRIYLFTSMQRAENEHAQVTKAVGLDIWQIREIKSAEYDRFFAEQRNLGMEFVRVDSGFATAELRIEDFGNAPLAPDARIMNLVLSQVVYGVRWMNMKQKNAPENAVRGAMESTLTMRNFAWREIGNAVLYIACPGNGERECTQAAHARIGEGRIVPVDACVQIADNSNSKEFIAAFTSAARAAAFAGRINPPLHPVAATFDDIVRLAKGCDGIILNIDEIGYRVQKDHFEDVLELRAKPPIAVRVRAEADAARESAEETQEAPRMNASLPNPDTALPDPDAHLPKREAIAPQPEPQTDAPAKKAGFFKRLFGK